MLGAGHLALSSLLDDWVSLAVCSKSNPNRLGGEAWDSSNQFYTPQDLDALSAAERKLLQSLAYQCLVRAIATGLSISLALNSPLQKFNF